MATGLKAGICRRSRISLQNYLVFFLPRDLFNEYIYLDVSGVGIYFSHVFIFPAFATLQDFL